ncbi:uncharacterized protein Z520_07996 [Fonsecaea multimorphosa CBS 102226]|uniref:Uncharacterized protein n=1 Tax=Fonsecaea multimorphosa CBS 102226 TaxID=1442371 RepID=A0A0D2KHR7_9EURO|nr:uncharacterized protein Z520_07996 [Fonsecaea multimorphosa CBS 102226]KIX96218.1 hypothetical protein Z520_07996 [Fonsecaea multimorphosa CBS 102226]OAL22205.1 hypothetical protein AYO22_07249 [Fonsecaea multimorphosa]
MVFSSLDPGRQTYHLWRRFSMPTVHGSRDAIAVEANVANQLNSAYSFLVQLIIVDFWVIMILAGVVLFLGKEKHSHNSGVIATGVWNAKDSPSAICKLTGSYLFKIKDKRRVHLFWWTLLAGGFVVAIYAIPIKVAPYIIIDNAAPVAASAIYVPALSVTQDAKNGVQINALEAPSAFRAAGSVLVANSTGRTHVSIDPPETIQDLGDGEAIIRVGYTYNITGVDFGLQYYPDLVLSVQGSCQTDYSWLLAETVDDSNIITDEYLLFNDPSQGTQNVSLYDSARPLGYFFQGPASPTGPAGNWTWGALVSSVQRQSITAGTDPWYLTAPDGGSDVGFIVQGGRPALSCWQNDVWSYRGHQSTAVALDSTSLPGLEISPGLQDILARFLSLPKIVTLATRLGASALVSTDTSLGEKFDAGASSFHNDLERLVFASYIATMNTLTDTTLFSTNNYGIPNEATGSDGKPSPGVDAFVIWSSEVSTLSILALIIIPVMTVAMKVIVWALTEMPFSWYRIQALQATVLYSCLHEKAAGINDVECNRQGDRPWVEKGDHEQAVFRPRFDRESRTLSWGAAEHREVTLGIGPTPLSPRGTMNLEVPQANVPTEYFAPQPQSQAPNEKSASGVQTQDSGDLTPLSVSQPLLPPGARPR